MLNGLPGTAEVYPLKTVSLRHARVPMASKRRLLEAVGEALV